MLLAPAEWLTGARVLLDHCPTLHALAALAALLSLLTLPSHQTVDPKWCKRFACSALEFHAQTQSPPARYGA